MSCDSGRAAVPERASKGVACRKDAIRVVAPAKVNFGLKVGQRRTDGYHDIESIFQAVSLCDTVTVKATSGEGQCEVRMNGKPMKPGNTLEKAYVAFEKVMGEVPSVSVEVDKKIPIGGGLGGGSSDAASFVYALEILTAPLTVEQKRQVASCVGCDVYFFLMGGGCAVVTGSGDIVKPIRARDDIEILLVCVPCFSATVEAYGLLDKDRSLAGEAAGNGAGQKRICQADDLEAIYRRPVKEWTFVNDFTPSVSRRFEALADAYECAKVCAPFCEMSGSGSTLYCAFDDPGEVESARRMLADNLGSACRIERVHPFGGSCGV